MSKNPPPNPIFNITSNPNFDIGKIKKALNQLNFPVVNASSNTGNTIIKKENNMEDVIYKTQKAKGIKRGIPYLLGTHLKSHAAAFIKEVPHKFVGTKDAITMLYPYDFPMFARPCPKTPKHGFVESRVVFNTDELKALWDQVKTHDPDGEIVLGPHLKKVKYNAIYVSSGTMSIGKGNDGATGGKNSISFPVAPEKYKKKLYELSGIGSKDSIYLEAVLNNESPWHTRWDLVQVRGGPAINTVADDYIPKKCHVDCVETPSEDLVEWETKVKTFKPGTVVYGSGHTLASHAAVHCILHKIPFITTFQPKVGDILAPTENRKRKVYIKRSDFKLGVAAANKFCISSKVSDMRSMLLFSLSVLHNWAYLKQSNNAGWLMGAASVVFARICTALALGENRHAKSKSSSSRDNIYKTTLKANDSYTKLPEAMRNFYHRDWASAFGGIPWATCTWYSCNLWNKIIKSHNKSGRNLSDEEIADIMSVMNRTTNLAHNGGWWFNKVASKEDMDLAADHPGFAAFCASDIYMEIHDKLKKTKAVDKLSSVGTTYSPAGITKDGKLFWVMVRFTAGSKYQGCKLKIKFEDGSSEEKKFDLSKAEIKGLNLRYDREEREKTRYTVLRVFKDNTFAIPGGNIRNISEILPDKKDTNQCTTL